jgi:hypothetical protein
MTKLLFITWDSDQTNYLETLFFPILKALHDKEGYECHIMQFSWAGEEEVSRLKVIAAQSKLFYIHYPISRKPLPFLGSLLAVFQGVFYIKTYVQDHEIKIVMPRSTMPAMMVNRLQDWLIKKQVKLIFDADGLPLEERVDFTGLEKNSIQYKWLKGEESKILKWADSILTRSHKSTKIHLDKIGKEHDQKFHKVSNGRSIKRFSPSTENRKNIREKFGLSTTDKLFVYSGSLGPQYCLEEMLEIFFAYRSDHEGSKFLILTRSKEYLKENIPLDQKKDILVVSCSFEQIPDYLSAADVAFNLRSPAPSLAGLAPIKLGEYLMMDLPVIVSKGIGDTEELLKQKHFTFLYAHDDHHRIPKVLEWINNLDNPGKNEIRKFGIAHFSLEKSVQEYAKALS